MDIINTALNYLQDFAVKSETIYHVNPWIFGILFFGSAIPLYFGYFLIGRSFVKIENKKIIRKKLDKNGLRIGVIISVIAWWIPYIYVFVVSKLPTDILVLFVVFLLLTGIFFVKTLHSKITASVKNSTFKIF